MSRSKGTRAAARNRDGLVAHVLMTPWLLGLILVTGGPFLVSLMLSFTDYSVFTTPGFIGLENYRAIANDERFWSALGVTFRYVVISVPVQLLFALILALVLDRGIRGLAFYRGAFYLPSLLGTSVGVAILWREIFGATGLVNSVLELFGINGQNWLFNTSTALGTLIILNVWTFGSPMVIFLAGLRNISQEIREAAAVDGATAWRMLINITLPLLTPMIFFNMILQMIGAFQTFNQAYIISEGTGGPDGATMFYTLYLYIRGFVGYDMGYASALAWILVTIIGVVAILQFWLSRKWVHYEDS